MGTTADRTDSLASFADSLPCAEDLACDGMPQDGPTVEQIEAEMLSMPHLTADIRHEADRATSHECRDARQVQTAAEHIGRIPDDFEAFHLVTNGRYALWDMVVALAEIAAPRTITSLHLATLGFSKKNIAEMVAMVDAGAIGRLRLLCSHYFRGTSKGIWEYAAEQLAKRPAASFLSIRTHCKLVAARLSDGHTITIESSANLRSCKNIEQLSIFGQPNVYTFHAGWKDGLFAEAGV
jgi:hypothetical protein